MLDEIINEFGTPCYVYDKQQIITNFNEFKTAFGKTNHEIFYAVKANPNIHILKILSELGSGFDTVSIGEIKRALHAGSTPQKIIFSGIAKSQDELEFAIEQNINSINIESEAEFNRILAICKRLQKTANIAFRVNPDIDAKTHHLISTGLKENKFGIDFDTAFKLYLQAKECKNLVNIKGMSCHIGSNLMSLTPILDAIDKIIDFNNKLIANNIIIDTIDIGGGLGIKYTDIDNPPSIAEYINAICDKLRKVDNIKIAIEPGRAIIANAGKLISKVEYIKQAHNKKFAIIDAGMNDYIRPALYQSQNSIKTLSVSECELDNYDIVGPICETSCSFAKNYPLKIKQGDYLVIEDTGAYGSSMGSNYNTRAKPPEILIDNSTYTLIRKRESFESLIESEKHI